MSRQRTTLAQVAKATGVSVATVSKVLNQRSDVAEPTRRRVLRQLRESGYQPTGAGAAVRSSGRMIEVVFANIRDAYSITVLEAITTCAQADGFDVVMGRGHPLRAGRYAADTELLLSSGRAGAILITLDTTSAQLELLRRADYPVVVVDPLHPGLSEVVSVGATNFAGGVTATEHLLALGHRRIGHAGGPKAVDCSQARLAGYTSALRQAGIPTDESLITHCEFRYDAGRRVAGALLDRDDRPTAIFAGNDEIALGLMEEARRRAIRVPQDLSLVGFDDTFMAIRSAPQLTTVAQPLLEMGRSAVRSLEQLINHEPVPSLHVELATRLMVRDSTAPLTPSRRTPA